MKYAWMLFFAHLLPVFGIAQQTDSVLLQRLQRPLAPSCETIAGNAQALIPTFDAMTQTDSIAPILTVWARSCGAIEPIDRVQILLDIANKTFVDTVFAEYIEKSVQHYHNRAYDINRGGRHVPEYYATYYDFVPVGDTFDQWTAQLAKKLLPEQKVGTSAYLFCLLFANDLEKFDKAMQRYEYEKGYFYQMLNKKKYTVSRGGWVISTGAWQPLNALGKVVNTSPLVGLSIDFQVDEMVFEIGALVRIPVNYHSFLLRTDSNRIERAMAQTGLTFGLRVIRQIPLGRNWYLEPSAGLYYESQDTDLYKGQKDGKDQYYNINTASATIGVGFYKRFGTQGMGLNLYYHILPYFLDHKLVSDLSGNAVGLTLSYRFF
jgi:hypothetical protein